MGVFFFSWKGPHIYTEDQNLLSISNSMTVSEQVVGRDKHKGQSQG